MQTHFLSTSRLILRNLEKNDADEMFFYRNDENCAKFQRWDSTSREDIEALIEQFKNCAFLSEDYKQIYAVALKSGEMVGDLTYFFSPDDCVTLGYTISPKYQRKGFAFEILSAVIGKIREKYPSLDIVCLIEKENEASIGLVKKLGFAEECYSEKIQSFIYTLQGQK